uniref:C-C motif chemokine n=1 Tax=Bos mutus grunniens TaxID=30521 RepID=A0A8B9X851_BOSMU
MPRNQKLKVECLRNELKSERPASLRPLLQLSIPRICPHPGCAFSLARGASQDSVVLSSRSELFSTNTPTDCCFSFVSRQIPRKFVDDYYETSSQCSKPGIIFKTKRGRQVCADPSEDWVQEYIIDLELNP